MQSFRSVQARLVEVAIFSDSTAVRFMLMVAELTWALTLWWYGDTFERPIYQAMALLAPENVWAGILAITGLLQGRFILVRRYHGRASIAFSIWNVLLWWFLVFGMYASVYPPPAAISGELSLALAASWVLCKTGRVIKHRVVNPCAICPNRQFGKGD